jgi:hypothetical protein
VDTSKFNEKGTDLFNFSPPYNTPGNDCRTNRCKGQAGSAVFQSSALLSKSQVNQSSVLQIPLAPELNRYVAKQKSK